MQGENVQSNLSNQWQNYDFPVTFKEFFVSVKNSFIAS
jgi:hypothetical protein